MFSQRRTYGEDHPRIPIDNNCNCSETRDYYQAGVAIQQWHILRTWFSASQSSSSKLQLFPSQKQ